MNSLDPLCVNTIRFLSVDQVERAKSGHPGLPLGAASMAYVLWDRCLRFNPANPKWFNRDRFVLSAGHGSALLYSLLHVYGYDLSIDELKNFRQWGSQTPGHPEYGLTPGVEMTTGPLGQGFATGVGMAVAEAFLGARYSADDSTAPSVVDHFTYAIVSDGDLMEGVASEAASLAGHLRLGKLIYLYDDNHITIDGGTDLAFSENVGKRFEAYGWHVLDVEDGNDLDEIERAIRSAQGVSEQPSLICVRTHIGYGSPKQDTSGAHGEPLGADAAAATRRALGWPEEPAFLVPDEVRAHCAEAGGRGEKLEAEWNDGFAAFHERCPDKAKELDGVIKGQLPEGWQAVLPVFDADGSKMATRAASGEVLNALAERCPTLVGGSADLAPSNKTYLKAFPAFDANTRAGRNFHFGVREHAMGAVVNGMALHGGVRSYGATFLIFSDYMRPAIRMAALMGVPSIFVFTHDSVALGEDGPTHQPVEQLMSLRLIPNLTVLRPADANETAAAWRVAIEHDGPTVIALSRQGLPILDAGRHSIAAGVSKGAYVLHDTDGVAEVILVASGSEVALAVAAREVLARENVQARVVSMPSLELFDAQPVAYREAVLPVGVPKLSIEAGSPRGWRQYVGDSGAIIGLQRFGASAPGQTALENLGFNVEHVVKQALALAGRSNAT